MINFIHMNSVHLKNVCIYFLKNFDNNKFMQIGPKFINSIESEQSTR